MPLLYKHNLKATHSPLGVKPTCSDLVHHCEVLRGGILAATISADKLDTQLFSPAQAVKSEASRPLPQESSCPVLCPPLFIVNLKRNNESPGKVHKELFSQDIVETRIYKAFAPFLVYRIRKPASTDPLVFKVSVLLMQGT